MKLFTFLKIHAIVLSLIGALEIFPLVTAIVLKETQAIFPFLIPSLFSIFVGACFIFFGKKQSSQLSVRQVFACVATTWIFVCIFGALPLTLGKFAPTFSDAIFESVSGFSGTGASIFSNPEKLPHSINLWRCETHWIGGMGIIALSVALFPLLGAGAFQLIKAESAGSSRGKITTKSANMAKTLWMIYVGFTILQICALRFCGLDFLDSVLLTFSTLGTGGFSQWKNSIAGANSLVVEIVCEFFMILASINFSLYFYAFTKKIFAKNNSELKAFFAILIFFAFGLTFALKNFYGSFFRAARFSIFQIISVITTTGFFTADFCAWPEFAKVFIFFLFFVGGCSGSTAGGIKVVRILILFKALKIEFKKMLHPHGVFEIHLDKKSCDEKVVTGAAIFVFVFFLVCAVLIFLGCIFGLNLKTSFCASISFAGNFGISFDGLGVTKDWGFLPCALKWIFSFAMLAGRLEFYNFLIFFTSDFWKR